MDDFAQKLPRRVSPSSRRVGTRWRWIPLAILLAGSAAVVPFLLPKRVDPPTLAYSELLEKLSQANAAALGDPTDAG